MATESEMYDSAPDWLKAADNHNISDSGGSFFSSLGNAPEFLTVSAISGLNSLYNSGVAVANVFNDELNQIEQNDTGEYIADYDEDLGEYYKKNQDSADLLGFIATSFIPGGAAVKGVKALQSGARATRAMQAGSIGGGMSRATGLLVPQAQLQVRKQAADYASRNAVWKLTDASTLKLIAGGTAQGALEGIAFESAVMATMFKAPMFEDMDAIDMVKNLGIGVAFGGVAGGILDGAKGYFEVSSLLKAAKGRKSALATNGHIVQGHKFRNADDIIAADDAISSISMKDPDGVGRIVKPVTPEEVLDLKLANNETGYSISPEAVEAEAAHLTKTRGDNLKMLENEKRRAIRNLQTGDKGGAATKGLDNTDNFGNHVADIFAKLEGTNTYNFFDNMQEYTRAKGVSLFNRKVSAIAKDRKLKKSEATKLAGEDTTSFVQLHSGGIGNVMESGTAMPGGLRLADRATPKQAAKFIDRQSFSLARPVISGAVRNPNEIEARQIWAAGLPTAALQKTKLVNVGDLPLMRELVKRKITGTLIDFGQGDVRQILDTKQLEDIYTTAQTDLFESLIEKKATTHFMELATDIRQDFIEGVAKYSDDADMSKNFSAQESYAAELSTHTGTPIDALDLHSVPKFMKASYRPNVTDESGNVLRGMQAIKYQELTYQASANRATAGYFGAYDDLFLEYSEDAMRNSWMGGSGQGRFTNAGGSYGSTEAITSANGNIFSEAKKFKIEQVHAEFDTHLQALVSNPEDALRWSVINEIVANHGEKFVLNADGTALVPRKIRDWEAAIEGGADIPKPALMEGTQEFIELPSVAVQDLAKLHIKRSASVNKHMGRLAAAQGNESRKFGDTFYPVRRDPKQFKHVAFVIDPKLSGVGHKKMIMARTGEELDKLIAKVPPQYKTTTLTQSDEFFQAKGDWMYDRSLHENYLDADLQSAGIRSNFFPDTDPQRIADDLLQHHIRQEHTVLREAMATKFQKFIGEMEKQGKLFATEHGSSTDHISKLSVSTTNNPYMAQVKSLFDISRLEDAPDWWLSVNQQLDKSVSQIWNKATEISHSAKFAEPEKLDQINAVFEEAGFKSAYYDAALNTLANSRIPQGVLTKFVRKANAFLTNTVLRLDAFNALNNKLGNLVIMSAEMSSLIKAIKTGDEGTAGELSKLMDLAVPGGEGAKILSPTKLISNSYKLLHGKDSAILFDQLSKHGLVPEMMDQYRKGIDAMTLSGTETVKDMSKRSAQLGKVMTDFAEWGAKKSGNEWSEKMNRAVAAVTMKQITDLAVKAGHITEKESWSYINTFVSRLNGTIRASERPLMFQGPIGQAMGLFQSYQLNLIQQTLRHVGESRGKSLAIMAGMQTSIYGASSLPGFHFINTSLVGNAYGNLEHKDLYTGSSDIFGDEGAEWLMYGAPSNILNASLYTRGNTNPRTWHIVPNPTNPGDLPFISGIAKATSSVLNATKKVADGAPVFESFLGAVEHLGISRPLAGLAASARGITNEGVAFTTQRSGNFLYENDLLSLTTLSRLAGAKPLDEAVMQNMFYRNRGYEAKDRDRRMQLGEAIRASMVGGGDVDQEAIGDFAEAYVRRGGNQKQFNSYFANQYVNATTSQAAQMAEGLKSHRAVEMQKLLGGADSLGD